jgi:hypothetical protein
MDVKLGSGVPAELAARAKKEIRIVIGEVPDWIRLMDGKRDITKQMSADSKEMTMEEIVGIWKSSKKEIFIQLTIDSIDGDNYRTTFDVYIDTGDRKPRRFLSFPDQFKLSKNSDLEMLCSKNANDLLNVMAAAQSPP